MNNNFEWKGGKTIEMNGMKSLRFNGKSGEYFKIWIVNVLLTLLTAGLYYPWAKVRNDRYLYASTTFEGRNFEYHATGKQLFLGYIIGIFLLIAYIILGEVSPEASIILPLVLFVAIPWIIWRSLKFGMRMTSFSNVHFSFQGTLKQSYINFFVYPFFLFLAIYLLPIGMALEPLLAVDYDIDLSFLMSFIPYIIVFSLLLAFFIYGIMKKKNVSYIINGTQYGQGIFRTKVEASKFWMIAFKSIFVWIFSIIVVLAIVGTIAYYAIGIEVFQEVQKLLENPEDFEEITAMITRLLPLLASIYMGLLLSMIIVLAYIVTRQRTYVFQNTTLDKNIKFSSTLKARSLSWVMISNFLAVIFTIGFAYPWAKVRMTKLIANHTCIDAGTELNNYISQQQKEGSSLGDQIGDAFDVDVGLGF